MTNCNTCGAAVTAELDSETEGLCGQCWLDQHPIEGECDICGAAGLVIVEDLGNRCVCRGSCRGEP